MIAFVGIRSRIAAQEAIVPEECVAAAFATLTKAQGRASPVEFTRPMSHRREHIQQREFLPPPRGTGTHADPHQQCGNGFDLSVGREPGHWETPASCAIGELRRCGTRNGLPGSDGEQSTAAHAELVDAHGLLASLVWRRVRPSNHSEADTIRRPSRSDLESLGKRRSAPPVTTAKTASLDQSPASIGALFSHLARRCLRSLAAKEKQA